MRAAGILAAGLITARAMAMPVSTTPFDREVIVHGTGEDDTAWRSAPQPIRPGGLYQLTFRARAVDGGGGGTATSGPLFCNRDLGDPGPAWREYASVFVAPDDLQLADALIKFGQWYRKGTLAFSDVAVEPCQPVYAHAGGFELGDGERVSGSLYEYRGPGGGPNGNHARVLASHHCPFNSNRWTFRAGAAVVYRHAAGGRRLKSASLTVGVTYHISGTLLVEASADGRTWRPLGELARVESGTFPVPAALAGGGALFVRLAARPAPADRPPEFQVAAYAFHAVLAGPPAHLEGRTHVVAVSGADPGVVIEDLGDGLPGGDNAVRLRPGRGGHAGLPRTVDVRVFRDGHALATAPAAPFARTERSQRFPYPVAGPGEYRVEVGLGPASALRFRFQVPALYDDGFGETLPASSDAAGLWWCTAGWKVSDGRALPAASGPAIRISAARGEAEAAQLVVHPARDLRKFRAEAAALAGPGGATIPAGAVDLLQVRYVPVAEASDETGGPGRWPDPLPPLTGSLTLKAGRNQPIWVRVRVPRGTPAGTYTGEIRLSAAGWHAVAPVSIEVYNFDLPQRMTLDTSFGFDARLAFQYHGVTGEPEERKLLDLYYANLAAHHVAPFAYDDAPLDSFTTTWTHTADGSGPVPVIDWAAWDREMARLIETYHFGPFTFPVPGMGGTGADEPGELAGFRDGTTQYTAAFSRWCALAEAHLEEKGWLDRAFVYWTDEPNEAAFPGVRRGMDKLRLYMPKVARLLTKEPRPEINGGPNLWCPILDAWEPGRVAERRALGERFWWYICTGPKAPFVGEFIDRPSPDLRVWCWQTWDQAVTGILIWATDYWTTPAAYPESGPPQNPYEDPMSWVREAPPGTREGWGNGDGRMFYPPLAAADGRPKGPVMAGPVDSIRWEHLRDGIEDYEYLAILKRLLATKAASLSPADRAVYAALLTVPKEISGSLTEWTKNDTPILARRDAVARAIEQLTAR